jgi:hypothetical protein
MQRERETKKQIGLLIVVGHHGVGWVSSSQQEEEEEERERSKKQALKWLSSWGRGGRN